jgi:RNA polymerase sigma-54 factor
MTAGPTLIEHLEAQLGWLKMSRECRRISNYVIGLLNENGYLSDSIESIALGAKASKRDVLAALSAVRQLDPPGVGARDLSECLLIQLLRKGYRNNKLLLLVFRHLPNISLGRFGQVMRALNLDDDQLRSYLNILKGLNPRPGAAYHTQTSMKYIVPEVIQQPDHTVILNETVYGKPTILYGYADSLAAEVDSSYITDQLRAAKWLLHCIEQRQKTIKSVSQYLCTFQSDFFTTNKLRPLTMKQVAEALGVHVSTISRSVHDKYLLALNGKILPLRRFFSAQRGTLSRDAVLNRIREFINDEDKTKPYSDGELAMLLQTEGVSVTRRTVTNMRNVLGVPPSAIRAF